jgi:hypothetical protein
VTDSNCDGVFKPFELAPEVCDDCGKTADDHAEKRPDMLPYKEAIWKYMLKVGGPYDFYGGYNTYDRSKILKHLKQCELDFSKMSTPKLSSEQEFNGTFAESNAYVSIVKGFIVCKCDEYELDKYEWNMQDWCVRDKTLGELIWNVVKSGESS